MVTNARATRPAASAAPMVVLGAQLHLTRADGARPGGRSLTARRAWYQHQRVSEHRGAGPRVELIEWRDRSLQRKGGQPPPAVGHGAEARARPRREPRRADVAGAGNVVRAPRGRWRFRSGWPARVRPPPDARAPARWRSCTPPGTTGPRRLGEAGGERPLEGDVVKHEPVQDDVKRSAARARACRRAPGQLRRRAPWRRPRPRGRDRRRGRTRRKAAPPPPDGPGASPAPALRARCRR